MMSGTTRTAKAVSQANPPVRVRDADVAMDVYAEPTVHRLPGALGCAVQDELFPARCVALILGYLCLSSREDPARASCSSSTRRLGGVGALPAPFGWNTG